MKSFQRRVLTIGVLKHGKRDGKSHQRNQRIKIRIGKKASVASRDTTTLTSTWSMGVSEGEAASVGSYKSTMEEKLLSQGRKRTPKSRNLVESMQGNHTETQIQLSKSQRKKGKQKEKGICHV